MQCGIIDGCLTTLDRQKHLTLAVIANIRINAQLVQKAIRSGLSRGFNVQCSTVERQIIETETTAIFQQTISGKRCFSTKEIAKRWRHQNGDRTIDLRRKHPAISLTHQCKTTRQRATAIGIKRQIDLKIIQCALASQRQINRRTTINIEHIGNNTVGRLSDFQIEIKLLISIGIGGAQRKITARTIKTFNVKGRSQRPSGKRQIAIQRYFRLQSKNIRTEFETRHIKAIDIDRQRQFRQAETRRFWRRKTVIR